MRSGHWILAVAGAFALTLGVCVADPPGKQTEKTVQSKPSAAAKPAKRTNYYEQLFGKPAPPVPKQAGKAAPMPASSAGPAQGPRRIPDDSEPKPDEKAVIHATYDRDPEHRESSQIEQVRAVAPSAASRSVAPPPSVKEAPQPADSEMGPQTPSVHVEWVKQSEISVGRECRLMLVVKNTGRTPARQLAVDAFFPNSIRLTEAKPKPDQSSGNLTWNIDVLAPGAEKQFRLALIPSLRGELMTTAQVRFTATSASLFTVEEPLLKVALKGPGRVMLGDPASHMVTISNPGTGVCRDVRIEARLPAGLEHPRGERLVMDVGSIHPGEARQVRLGLAAIQGGEHELSVTATSSSETTSTESVTIKVDAPSLKVALEGPGLRYKGRNAQYELTVTNDGSVPNHNIRVVQQIADGFEFVSAGKGGTHDAAQRSVQWFVGRLEPGQSTKLQLELKAAKLGSYKQSAVAISDSGIRTEASTETTIDGTASLSMELADLDDPVEVGGETAYEIRITNDGSKAASNVAIACELPEGVKLIDAKGPSAAKSSARQVVFQPIAAIAPGKTAVYRVHIQGTAEGHHRFRARVTSDSVSQPLLLEELTKFYGDAK